MNLLSPMKNIVGVYCITVVGRVLNLFYRGELLLPHPLLK